MECQAVMDGFIDYNVVQLYVQCPSYEALSVALRNRVAQSENSPELSFVYDAATQVIIHGKSDWSSVQASHLRNLTFLTLAVTG